MLIGTNTISKLKKVLKKTNFVKQNDNGNYNLTFNFDDDIFNDKFGTSFNENTSQEEYIQYFMDDLKDISITNIDNNLPVVTLFNEKYKGFAILSEKES